MSHAVPWTDDRAREALRGLFAAACRSADPGQVLAAHLPPPPDGRVVVVGAGKASAAMAAALDAAWPGADLRGVVVTRDGHALPGAAGGRIEVLEAAHPVPDARSEAAARRLLATVRGLSADDLVVALISGGGSALAALPAAGLRLEDKQAVIRALLASGASIREINAVRAQLSAIKGGELLRAARPARMLTLLVSDVPGDDPALIASGPTVPGRASPAQARELVARYGLPLSPAVRERLDRAPPRLPIPDSPAGPDEVRLIAAPILALEAAADAARAAGLTPLILGDAIEGESREAGRVMAGIALGVQRHGHPLPAPAVLLSGGETTVTLGVGGAHGRGGRNTEFLLGLATALGGAPGIWALAGDTDGIDGTEDAAGATVTPTTLARGRAAGRDPHADLAAHDSYSYFAALGDLLMTGPTRTNVNDFRAVLVLPAEA